MGSIEEKRQTVIHRLGSGTHLGDRLSFHQESNGCMKTIYIAIKVKLEVVLGLLPLATRRLSDCEYIPPSRDGAYVL